MTKGLLSLDEVKRRHIIAVLDACDWCISKAARILKVSRTSLQRMLRKYGY